MQTSYLNFPPAQGMKLKQKHLTLSSENTLGTLCVSPTYIKEPSFGCFVLKNLQGVMLAMVLWLLAGNLLAQESQFVLDSYKTNHVQLVTIPGVCTDELAYTYPNSIVGAELIGSNVEVGRVIEVDTNVLLNWSTNFYGKGFNICGLNYDNGVTSLTLTNLGWDSQFCDYIVERSPDMVNWGMVDAVYWPDTQNINSFFYAETNTGPYFYRTSILKFNSPVEAQQYAPPMD